jgi:hypothetical protein
MIDDRDLEVGIDEAERARLSEMGERLARERPVPNAAFRGTLRTRLSHRRGVLAWEKWASGSRWRPLAATYSCLGVILLAVAAVGLAGAGPFAS